ncbi:dethiobiotin synthase [Thalassotalea profundi]|uniref:ATP-dependent dethiobiotin synthetase BioD n=1 Tax=Thalassotalea profundi TaxID=2036687 RepID=A0ABQ3IGH4_9GAMM|nr:dethiobiotin synthase [Thalassotalea profundi]GHE82750.1 ATP-dependent dethiobiotin synthetase BioD [Thalassotalea profundi]
MNQYFITATDTDAGKTHFSRAFIRALVALGQQVAVYKPISAGCYLKEGQLVNEDALFLLNESNSGQTLKQVNPIAFEAPIAPHIAAKKQNVVISVKDCLLGYQNVAKNNVDIIVTEGAGGWRLPLGNNEFLSSFAVQTNQQVILVVNIKLGCLNHALLTYEAIINDQLNCVGWVANCQEDMPFLDDNISELTTLIPAPLLATFEPQESIETAAKKINLTLLSL